jgi:hypothetical protein
MADPQTPQSQHPHYRGTRPRATAKRNLSGDWDSPQTNAEIAADFGIGE